jgi:ABC-type nitrate/sulfonate/bicarbonate transport system permease component
MVTRHLTPVILPLLSVTLLILVIEALNRAGMLPVFIPGPLQIGLVAWNNPRLVIGNLLPTMYTATMGYVIAVALTFTAACIGVLVRRLRGSIYSTGVVINAIPVIATAPLLALWLGTGGSTQIVIAALSTQFPLLVGAMQGLATADERQRELLYVLNASRVQVVWYLRIPTALPYIFAGLKVAAPLAVLGAITAEWAGADRGVGAMMLYALFSYDIEKVWLAVLLCCGLAGSAYALLALLERQVVTWERTRT